LRHSDDQSIGSAIKEFFKAYHLDEKMNETRLIRSWEKVLGKLIANHTRDLKVRNKILFVKIDSPALRNELLFQKGKIIDSLNGEVNAKVIEDIVFN
jgi:predicted nucleic acid-binding Zn ribbon protein